MKQKDVTQKITGQITLEWRENQKNYKKEIDRMKFYGVMNGIRNGFTDDNEVSTYFCKIIIPYADSIFIDKDRNAQLEVPFIQYTVGTVIKTIDIIRYHKIIWAILNRYCQMD